MKNIFGGNVQEPGGVQVSTLILNEMMLRLPNENLAQLVLHSLSQRNDDLLALTTKPHSK